MSTPLNLQLHARLLETLVKGDKEGAGTLIRERDCVALWCLTGVPTLIRALRESQQADNDVYEFILLLLNHGADVDCGDHSGNTALHEATRSIPQRGVHLPLIALLLRRGADVNAINENGRAPLHYAFDGHAGETQCELVRLLLACGADVSIQNEDNDNVLLMALLPKHYFTSGGNLRSIRLLLEKGASVDDGDMLDNTPLHRAAANCSVEAVKLLTDFNADVNARNDCGNTPLHEAIQCYNSTSESVQLDIVRVVKLLLDHGADASLRNDKGQTPLHEAWQERTKFAREEVLSLVRLLFDHQTDRKGVTILHQVVASSPYDVEVVKLLLECEADVNAQDQFCGSTPLSSALDNYTGSSDTGVMTGFFEMIQLLLHHKADLLIVDDDGCTPLHTALRQRTKFSTSDICYLVQLLLDHHADVNFDEVDSGITCLQLSMLEIPFDVELSRLLLDYKADVNKKGDQESPPLHWAIKCYANSKKANRRLGFLELIQLFLDRGADVNATDINDLTALQFIAKEPRKFVQEDAWALVKMLLEHQADVNVKDSNGDTPLHIVAKSSHFNLEIGKLLLFGHADVNAKNRLGNTPLYEVVWRDSCDQTPVLIDFLRLLVDKGANASDKTNHGDSPLHAILENSIQCGEWDDTWQPMAKVLLEHGKADVNAMNRRGYSLLHRALTCDDDALNIVTLLADHGADVNIRDTMWGDTPLHRAFKVLVDGNLLDMVTLLVNRGADALLTNKYGSTALHEAVKRNDVAVVKLLVDRLDDIDVKDRNGDTPLALAVGRGNVECASVLLERGADMYFANHHCATPFSRAFAKGRLTMIYRLIRSSSHQLRLQVRSILEENPKVRRITDSLEERNVRMRLDE